MKTCFRDINDRYELKKEVKDSLFTDKRTLIVNHLKKKYSGHTTSSSLKPKFPNIHIDTFVPFIMDYFSYSNENIIENIDSLNRDWNEILKSEDTKKYELANSKGKQGFCLGILLLKSFMSNKRSGIPSAHRKNVWKRYIGQNIKGNCFCCQRTVLFVDLADKEEDDWQDDFHCGHFISKKNGGDDSIENLRVLCAACNWSMGSRNIPEYMAVYYPNK